MQDINTPSTTRDAIIYLPAISRVQPTDAIDAIANRLVGAFDRNATSDSANYYLEKRPQELFREFDTQVYSIIQEGEQDRAVADLYELDYRDLLTKSARDHRPATHVLHIFWTSISIFHRLIKGASSGSKTRLEKWQVFYGWLMGIIVSLYLFLWRLHS